MAKNVKQYTKRDGTKVKAHKRSGTKAKYRVAGRKAASAFDELLKGTKQRKPVSGPRMVKNMKRELNKLTRSTKRKNKRLGK